MSSKTIIVLLVFYVFIALASAWERNWWRVLYFVGAIIISVAVLGMTERP